MQFEIDIEEVKTETKTKKDKSGTYQLQEAWAHCLERDGSPSRHPVRMNVFVPTDGNNTPQPYKPGHYVLDPRSFRINQYGSLEIGFLQLMPKK